MPESLYDHAGGAPAMLALARAHHARCLADPVLNHPFSHDDQHPQHVERLAAYWGQVLGGPAAYTDEHAGNQPHLLTMHAGNGDMTDLGERFLRCFIAALDDAQLPADQPFRDAMAGYMRWAVDDVLSFHERTDVKGDEPMPRWDWEGSSS